MFWEQAIEISSDSSEGGIRVGFGGKIVVGEVKKKNEKGRDGELGRAF